MADFQRPALHFTPQTGWINDPNGLIWDGNQYHLFAQYNPNDIVWGPMHWLHATSDDMLTWKEQGIALWPDALGTMFSGSACRLPDGRMALMYTAHGQREQQCVAFSQDGMRFEKYAGNPVIPSPGAPDFRDPKVFWNERYQCWSVVVSMGDRVGFYRSEDLCHWEKTGEFGRDTVPFGDLFECPDCFPLTTPEGETIWALTASMIFLGGETGCRMRYWLGEFDGDTFRETETVGAPRRLETGYDSYAGVTWFGLPERYFTSWIHSKSLPSPLKQYTGCLSLPRKLALKRTESGLYLTQCCVLPKLTPFADHGQLPQGACCLDLRAEQPFTLRFFDEDGQETLNVEWTAQDTIRTWRAPSDGMPADKDGSTNPYNKDDYRMTQTPRLTQGTMSMRIVIDAYTVEIFADEGLYAHALLTFAKGGLSRFQTSEEVSVMVSAL